MGDRLVPDYLTQVQEGAFYGWPYAYLGSHPQPGFAERAPEKVQQAVMPDVLFEAHSSAIGLVFYDGTMFPPEYRDDAFVALKGRGTAPIRPATRSCACASTRAARAAATRISRPGSGLTATTARRSGAAGRARGGARRGAARG